MNSLAMPELIYVGLIFGLFVIPRLIARLGIPSPITALFLGIGARAVVPKLNDDITLNMMSLFGITSLFLFAGLDVDIHSLKKNHSVVIQHVVLTLVLMAFATFGFTHLFHLPLRESGLLALGLLTPSCGFIFDTVGTFQLSDDEKFWVKSKAVATEIVALVFMIFALQSESAEKLGISIIGITLMILIVPVMFRFFAKAIAPYAEGSEFAFLLMTAILCAVITRRLGAYYLVGAFFVGTAAHQFEKMLPEATAENTIHAMRVFANFFVPFYFFKAGMEIQLSDLGPLAILFAFAWAVVIIPARVFVTAVHRKFFVGQTFASGKRVGFALLPTLVFGLVIAGLLRERFHVSSSIFGGLIIFTIVATMVPGLLLKSDSPKIPAPVTVPPGEPPESGSV